MFPFAALPELKTLLEAQREATKALEKAENKIIPHVFIRLKGKRKGQSETSFVRVSPSAWPCS